MTFGKNARVGNITVFSRQGAIDAYKTFAKICYDRCTLEAVSVLTKVENDMYALGFTHAEVEELELSVL